MSTFCPGCPGCEEELLQKLSPKEGPPPATQRHRHPESDPKEAMRKELTQCQNCWVSRSEKIKLNVCSACKIDLYCSKECQRKAWPSHKEKCRINRKLKEIGSPDQIKVWELLRTFTSKHRPTLAEAGCRALNVGVDIKNATRNVLIVFLQHRKEHKRTENAFYATHSDVVPFEWFGIEKAAEMREQLSVVNKQNKKCGLLGTLFVVLCCTDPMMMNVAPVGFSSHVQDQRMEREWKQWLTKRLNDGIVS